MSNIKSREEALRQLALMKDANPEVVLSIENYHYERRRVKEDKKEV